MVGAQIDHLTLEIYIDKLRCGQLMAIILTQFSKPTKKSTKKSLSKDILYSILCTGPDLGI
jgi:hypothetical protein